MSLKMLLAWSFLSLCFLSYSQEKAINGYILSSNNLPVSGAIISVNEETTTSLIDGSFTLLGVNYGKVVLKISHKDYEAYSKTLIVNKTTSGLTIVLNPIKTVLDEVTLFGKSELQKEHESPVSVVRIDEDFMNNNRENSLMQTLSKVPGVSTINIGSGQSKPLIRGLGFNRVSVVQNGIKHEAQQWGNDHGLEIDQYGIERIRIIKGAASLLYGSDAIAGVVDIVAPKIPLLNTFSGEVNFLAESNNDLLGISAGLQQRKNKWFYRARLTYRDYGDYKVPTNTISYDSYIFELHENHLRNTAGREANAAFSLGFVDDNFKSETFFSNVNAKNGFFANAHGLEVRTSTIDYDSSNRDIDLPFHKVNHFKLVNNSTLYKGAHTLHFELGFQNNHREEHSEPVPHGYMPKPDDSQERVFYKNTWSLNARDAFKLNEKHHLVFGLNTEYQNNNIGGWGFLIPEYDRFTIGAFAFDHFDFNEKLHFHGGLRYDFGVVKTQAHFDNFQSTVNNDDGSTSYIYLQRALNKTLDFSSISGSVGLSYVLPKTTYKFNIGKSFRIPLANELASDGVNYHFYRYERGNLNLDPEQSYQLDIDVDYASNKFSFGISPFVNWFENFIYLNPTSDYYETLQIYEYTQSKVFRVGGEARFQYKLLNNLTLDSSLEFVHSRQTSGPKKYFTIPFSPPLSGVISANYTVNNQLLCFKNNQFSADFRITANQNDIVPPEEKTEGYNVLNIAYSSEFNLLKANKPARLRFKLNNVFNTTYFNHTSFYRLIDVPEAGRNLSLSITIPF